MCGRFTLRNPRGPIWLAEVPEDLGAPRYNIAPGQSLIAVAQDRHGQRVVRAVVWGFRPHWVAANRRAPINARVEGVADKPLFQRAFMAGRCLIPADGWYEWQAMGAAPKQPYFFRRPDDEPFWLAGIAARGAAGEVTAAIITKPSAPAFAAIHERMPATLMDDTAAARWITRATPAEQARQLLLSQREGEGDLETYPVSRAVNVVDNDGAKLIAPHRGG